MNMNEKLILEIQKQKSLINFLIESDGGSNKYIKAIEEIFGLSGIKRVPQRNRIAALQGERLDDLQDLYMSYPHKPTGVNSLEDLAADLKKIGSDPTKMVKESDAKGIVEHIEKEIFTNIKYTKPVGGVKPMADLIIDAIFKAKNTSTEIRAKYAAMKYYAELGDEANMLKTKRDLETGCGGRCLPDSWIKYAESKYIKQVTDVVANNEAGFFEKFKQGLQSGLEISKWKKTYVSSLGTQRTEELMTRFFALSRSIQQNLETSSGKYDFSQEITEMNQITAEIARIKDVNLKNLWIKWRDQMPDYVKNEIKGNVENSPIYIKYVKFFEENAYPPNAGPAYSKPQYIVSRFKAMLKVFNDPEVKGFWPQVGRGLKRISMYAAFGDFRTAKELSQLKEALGGSNTRRIAHLAVERAISYAIYYPVFMSFINTMYDFAASRAGYKEVDDPKNPGKKIKVPNTNLPLSDPEKFFTENKSGWELFASNWLDNAIGEWRQFGGNVSGGKFISPIGSAAISKFIEYQKEKKVSVTPTPPKPEGPKPTEEEKTKQLWEKIMPDIEKQLNVSRATIDTLINARKLAPGDKDLLIKLKDGIDSLRGTGVWRKSDEVMKIDSSGKVEANF